MTLDWWGLGLQAVNVVILVWLLGRVFWRPVAGAITARQDMAQAMLDGAQRAQTKADAANAEVAATRAAMAAERDALLAKARTTAEGLARSALQTAQAEADALIAAALAEIERNRKAARKDTAMQAGALSVEIAARLLQRFATPDVQAGFVAQVQQTLAGLSAPDRHALAASPEAIEIVTATALDGAAQAKIEQTIRQALGAAPAFRFATDPDLIAGLELRNAHFVLHNSWRADLNTIRQEIANAE